MAENDPIGPASKSLAATLGIGKPPKAPEEHKAVEKTEGVTQERVTPPVIFRRGDLARDLDRDVRVTVLKAYIAVGNTGEPIHEVASKSGERWLQWQTKLIKK